MTAQKSSNPFDGLKIASEDSLNRSAKPKVTASKSEKQETDDINADLTTDDGADQGVICREGELQFGNLFISEDIKWLAHQHPKN